MFDPYEFFRLGQRLLQTWNDEETHRTAIGRAYYACHLIARDAMFGQDKKYLTGTLKKRILGHRGGDHDTIVKAIAVHPRVPLGSLKTLSDQLGELKDARVQADYYCDPAHPGTLKLFTKYQVKDWNQLAHATLAIASHVLPNLKGIPSWP